MYHAQQPAVCNGPFAAPPACPTGHSRWASTRTLPGRFADLGRPVVVTPRSSSLARRRPAGQRYVLKSLGNQALAAVLLLVAAPALAVIAAGIKLTSPGPVFYRQFRGGLDHKPILLFKFRTMYADRCDVSAAVEVRQATPDDSRITPIGRFLRRTSFDELPQLLNVLCGEMNIVGPRPHALAHDIYYGDIINHYFSRYCVKPGMTGLAQVNGFRGETKTADEMRRRIEFDLEYIENWSLLFDLRIFFHTVPVIYRGFFASDTNGRTADRHDPNPADAPPKLDLVPLR